MQIASDLNEAQRKAVEAGDGPVLIVAGPGTGKTKTLTARIVRLIESGRAMPEQILALTFTNKAAEEMRMRVQTMLQGRGEPRIATFHALCHELLGDDVAFVSEQERVNTIKSLSRPAMLKSLSAREVGLLISKAKNGTPEDDAVHKLVQAYNAALQEQGLRDFDDLLLQTRQLLQDDKQTRQTVQGRYKYILVDEFQDTNRLQYELLGLLRGNDNLFVIGDPNQSIYGFRGASGGIFEQFAQDFANTQKITLHVNYRSVPAVVRLANAIFPDASPLRAHIAESGQVRAVQVLNEYSEANWILGEIQRAIGGGDFLRAVSNDERTKHRTLKDFAILYRSRSCAAALQRAIAESGLPYQIVGDGSPYDKPEVQNAITLLKSLASGEDVALKNITKTQARTLLAGINQALPPSQLVDAIAAKFGVEQTHELTGLANALVRFDDLQAAVNYLEDIAQQQFYDPSADAVTLLTIHAAKGLEFPHVFLIGAEEGILPHAKADADEEKRLFYVAATRARERLDILHVQSRSAKPAKPSRFVAELPETILPKIIDENLATDQRRAQKRKLKRSQQTLF
jgi:superfamily I DNA/RNA helicase